ncbi:MAG: DUF6261 family protein [Paludibacter sp.]
MQTNFVNFSFSKVRRPELPEITEEILKSVEKHNPVTLKIAGMYNLLSELRPLLNILAVKYDGYPNSKDVKAQVKMRNTLLSAIRSHMVAIEKANVTTTAQQAKLALPYLKSYLNGIYSDSPIIKSGRVNQMLKGLTDNDEMNDALSALGLAGYMDELRASQQSVNQGESHRKEVLGIRPKFNNKNAKQRVITAIQHLLKAIDLAKMEHTDLDYMPLINELNVVLTNRQSVIRSRSTRNTNSNIVANKTKAANSTVKDESTANDNKTTTDAPSTTTDASAA